jgi:hypothetical protein
METQVINGKAYKVINGTYYNAETSDKTIEFLERVRKSRERIVLDYGNTETMESWGDVYGITGTVSRSTGQVKIPLLIHNSRSLGGGAILTHCIIKAYSSKGKRLIFSL